MISAAKITELTVKFVEGNITLREQSILDEWLDSNGENRIRFEERINVANLEKAIDLFNRIQEGSEGINFEDTILKEYLKEGKPSELETPRIITDIKAISSSLLEIVKKDLKHIHSLSDRDFEILMAEFFDKKGYDVTLTPSTRDGGKDLILLDKKEFGNHIFFVECKRYALENPVGVGVIRSLYGAVVGKATAGIVATTSVFSRPAIEFTQTIQHQMSLMDYEKICELIRRLDNK